MFEDITRVHFVGIGGIGMSALAKWFHAHGKTVSGSDVQMSHITDQLETMGIPVASGHHIDNVPDDVDLLIYSPAVPATNVERDVVRDAEIDEMSYPEALGMVSKQYSSIVVTGTHGKSTTTAMLGKILAAAGYDPTVIVGTMVEHFEYGNLRVGNGRFLVVEGCEYRAHMLHLEPEMIVLTNIHADHLDYYRDIDHIRDTFQTFIDKLTGKGMLLWNADDVQSQALETSRGISFAMDGDADYVGRDREVRDETQTLDIVRTNETNEHDEPLGTVELLMPGAHNAANGLAATAAAVELGVPFHTCEAALKTFKAPWRRFEHVGSWREADVFSDYGHHPHEVKETLKAARERFPRRRVVLCFQPHQHARTKALFEDFVDALKGADHEVVVSEIYTVSGRTESTEVSSRHIVDAVKESDPAKDIRFAANFKEAEKHLRDIVKANDVVIFQGAGNIDDLARELAI